MKYCSHCGAEAKDDAKFCEYCGNQFADEYSPALPPNQYPSTHTSFPPYQTQCGEFGH